MKNLIIGILIVLAIGEVAARAEMRMWTDKKGNSIKAEFVKIVAGKVILKTPAGKRLNVLKSGLSNADQIYLANAVPPKIDIDVDIDNDRKKLHESVGYTRTREKIKGHVTLIKKNREPCNRTFSAYLYLFRKDLSEDEISVLDKSKHEFSFEHQKKVSFDGNQSKVEYTKYDSDYYHYSRNRNPGSEYAGYLVIVEDKGKIICVKGSRRLYENKASQIRKAKKGSLLDNLDRD